MQCASLSASQDNFLEVQLGVVAFRVVATRREHAVDVVLQTRWPLSAGFRGTGSLLVAHDAEL